MSSPNGSNNEEQARPPKRLFKAASTTTRRLSFELPWARKKDDVMEPVADEDEKCLVCFIKASKKIKKHLLDQHQIKAKMCKSCKCMFRIKHWKVHKCQVQVQVAAKNGSDHAHDPYAFQDDEDKIMPALPSRRKSV